MAELALPLFASIFVPRDLVDSESKGVVRMSAGSMVDFESSPVLVEEQHPRTESTLFLGSLAVEAVAAERSGTPMVEDFWPAVDSASVEFETAFESVDAAVLQCLLVPADEEGVGLACNS